jgi:hypothetical protein
MRNLQQVCTESSAPPEPKNCRESQIKLSPSAGCDGIEGSNLMRLLYYAAATNLEACVAFCVAAAW